MTFSLLGRCGRSGEFGVVVTSSSPCVASRCAWVRAGAGAVASQNITNPALGELGLALLSRGPRCAPGTRHAGAGGPPPPTTRQITVLGAKGRGACHSGARTLGTWGGRSSGGLHRRRQHPRLGWGAAGDVRRLREPPRSGARRASPRRARRRASTQAARKDRCARPVSRWWTRWYGQPWTSGSTGTTRPSPSFGGCGRPTPPRPATTASAPWIPPGRPPSGSPATPEPVPALNPRPPSSLPCRPSRVPARSLSPIIDARSVAKHPQHTCTMAKKRTYRVVFHNQGKVYELYARSVGHSGEMYGFVEIGELIFGERTAIPRRPFGGEAQGRVLGSRAYLRADSLHHSHRPGGQVRRQQGPFRGRERRQHRTLPDALRPPGPRPRHRQVLIRRSHRSPFAGAAGPAGSGCTGGKAPSRENRHGRARALSCTAPGARSAPRLADDTPIVPADTPGSAWLRLELSRWAPRRPETPAGKAARRTGETSSKPLELPRARDRHTGCRLVPVV